MQPQKLWICETDFFVDPVLKNQSATIDEEEPSPNPCTKH